MATYWEGQGLKIETTFATPAGVATDPSDITLTVTDPAGTATLYYYSVAGHADTITRTGTGVYNISLTNPTPAGRWLYRWDGSGALDAVDEGSFQVTASRV